MKKENKHKFSISIPPDCYNVLTRFAKVTGTTKSAFISEVLESQLEVLKELTKTVEKAQKIAAKNAEKKVSLLDT